ERAKLVLNEVHKLVPSKPIKYVVNTHQHFDTAGGLRTLAAAGATVVTASSNKAYYERILSQDSRAAGGAKSLTVVVEGVEGKRAITDGMRTLQLYLLQASPHNDAILCAYLPAEKALVEAHVFTPGAANPALMPLARNLADNIARLHLDVSTIVPLQGQQ